MANVGAGEPSRAVAKGPLALLLTLLQHMRQEGAKSKVVGDGPTWPNLLEVFSRRSNSLMAENDLAHNLWCESSKELLTLRIHQLRSDPRLWRREDRLPGASIHEMTSCARRLSWGIGVVSGRGTSIPRDYYFGKEATSVAIYAEYLKPRACLVDATPKLLVHRCRPDESPLPAVHLFTTELTINMRWPGRLWPLDKRQLKTRARQMQTTDFLLNIPCQCVTSDHAI